MASACTFPPGTSNESLSFVPTGGGSETEMNSPPMLSVLTREKSCRSPPCQATRAVSTFGYDGSFKLICEGLRSKPTVLHWSPEQCPEISRPIPTCCFTTRTTARILACWPSWVSVPRTRAPTSRVRRVPRKHPPRERSEVTPVTRLPDCNSSISALAAKGWRIEYRRLRTPDSLARLPPSDSMQLSPHSANSGLPHGVTFHTERVS